MNFILKFYFIYLYFVLKENYKNVYCLNLFHISSIYKYYNIRKFNYKLTLYKFIIFYKLIFFIKIL